MVSPSATRRFELVSDASKKFWEITLSGAAFTDRFGRIGTVNRNQCGVLLRETFREEILTFGWTGRRELRFLTDHSAILIWDSQNQSDWFVGAADKEALASVLKGIWKFDDAAEVFYGVNDSGERAVQIRRAEE